MKRHFKTAALFILGALVFADMLGRPNPNNGDDFVAVTGITGGAEKATIGADLTLNGSAPRHNQQYYPLRVARTL
jgi:hypothetical protein